MRLSDWSFVSVSLRNNGQKEAEVNSRACSFYFKIGGEQESGIEEMQVCLKAFCAIVYSIEEL